MFSNYYIGHGQRGGQNGCHDRQYDSDQGNGVNGWAPITGSGSKEGNNALEKEIKSKRKNENVEDKVIAGLLKNMDIKL